MKQRYVLAVLAAMVGAAPATAQQAGPLGPPPHGMLPPHEILIIVRSTGLDPIAPPVRRGLHYMVRAVGDDGRPVAILIDARSGEIISMTAARLPPRGAVEYPRIEPEEPDVEPGMPPGTRLGPYERIPSPGYIPPRGAYQVGPPVGPGGPGVYRVGPPVVYGDDDPPVVYGNRPPAPILNAPPVARGGPPRVITATPPDDVASAGTGAGRGPSHSGALPPPPERFPQHAAPVTVAKPKPDASKAEKKAAANIPKQAPLPKPRPPQSAAPSATPAKSEPAKSEPVTAPQKTPGDAVPN